jgi:predicted CoA-binding protein
MRSQGRARRLQYRPAMTDRDEVEALLAEGRLAVVGVSVSEHDPTRIVLRALAGLGHPLVVVRPGVAEIDGATAYPRIRDVPGRLDGVVVMTLPRMVEEVIDECAAAGVPRVWVDPACSGGLEPRKLADYRRHGMVVVTTVSPLVRMTRGPGGGGGQGRRPTLRWFADHLALRRSPR